MLRFSQRPIEDVDINTLRIALMNYIVSKQRNEDFVIRIEDIDQEKNIEGKDAEIIALLDLFDIKYREVLYSSKGFRFHQAMAIDLLHRKKAFNCFCDLKDPDVKYDGTCENLPAEEVIDNPNPFRVRMKKPLSPISFMDRIKGKLTFSLEEIDSIMILKEDKTPTYIFASAVDDMLNDISVVIRDEDSVLDTPKQIYIRQQIGYDKEIEYAHVPSLVNNEGKKIDGNDTIGNLKWLLEEGFLPQAISNYLISIGTSTPQAIFTIDEAIEWFDLEKVSSSVVVFDLESLRMINKEHLRRLDDKELSRYVGFADSEIGKLAKLYLDEVSTTKQLKEKIAPVFAPKKLPEALEENAQIVRKIINDAPYFEDFESFKTYLLERSTFKEEELLKILQFLFTGRESALELQSVYEAIKNYIKEIIK
ncbi:MAG: glutamate--tRNA ligase [Epsilonproteobacteria bacterium]|nr:glutamate--tRNA ligase [Campylobacterota bacterium]